MEQNKEKQKEKIELIKKSFTLKAQNKYKEALEALYKALEYDEGDEDNVELLSQVGTLHILLNNLDRALEEFQKVLLINSKHRYSMQKCYEIYITKKEYDKAFELAKAMCDEEKSPENYYNYLNVLIKQNKTKEAFDLFLSLKDEIRIDPEILYLISFIYPDKRKLLLERILSIAPNHTNANLALAQIELDNKNYDNVAKYCANIDEDNSMIYYFMAQVELSRNNTNKALELLSDAIKIDNDEHDFYYDIAKIYIDICWFNEAILALKKSISHSLLKDKKENLDLKYFITGFILIKLKEFKKAALNLNLIDEKSKMYDSAKILLQTINLENSNLSQAKEGLEKIYKKEKDNVILLDSLAYIYKELKMYSKAIDMYNLALKLYPNSIFYKLEIIDLLIDCKRYDEAKILIEQFKKENQNCANIYNSLARIYYRLKDFNNAFDSINQYLNLDCNSAEGYYFKGLILNDMERFNEARNEIYAAIKLNPASAKYYSQMARSYDGLGDFKAALLYTNEAIELNQGEVAYKKQAYEIALKTKDDAQINMYEKLMKRSEAILRLQR